MAIIPLLSGTHVATILAPVLVSVAIMNSLISVLRPDISDRENRIKPISAGEMKTDYDFIVVGGGGAGAVVANRLSEIDKWSVLLLEAGPDEPEICDVPFAYNFLQGTPLDWQFKPEPSNASCLAMKNHQCTWPRGKALGGTTILNGMMYSRGNKKDYDYWAAQGNPGWEHDSIFKYFKKSEDMRIDEFKGSSYHSTGGGLSIEHYRYRTPITNHLVNAGTEMGYEILDANAGKQSGFMISHSFLRDGLRCSTAKGFLRPASKRENLHVGVLSMVEKILIRTGEYY
ncbi:glucose dehydrogenase [FAD, quinone]-like [Hylaeus anthracinus]|uniref:glucose dehydrogenase [FAD, quinone]-like n=1 Tax=Hylaeus anthracinus TaxID=313031 RepID=UPI0023B9E487|nr:glucose dehydrogenase [FAD, quinone]-like [Hylaeus anthracinus]